MNLFEKLIDLLPDWIYYRVGDMSQMQALVTGLFVGSGIAVGVIVLIHFLT